MMMSFLRGNSCILLSVLLQVAHSASGDTAGPVPADPAGANDAPASVVTSTPHPLPLPGDGSDVMAVHTEEAEPVTEETSPDTRADAETADASALSILLGVKKEIQATLAKLLEVPARLQKCQRANERRMRSQDYAPIYVEVNSKEYTTQAKLR